MDSKQDLILIDTNVFVIDLRYKRDINYPANASFLERVAENETGFTTLINLLELCGILSFNLNHSQLMDLWNYFQKRYNISVLPPPDMASEFPTVSIKRVFEQIEEKVSLGDALVLAVARQYLSFVPSFVTWDKAHFEGKFPGKVVTPAEYFPSLHF